MLRAYELRFDGAGGTAECPGGKTLAIVSPAGAPMWQPPPMEVEPIYSRGVAGARIPIGGAVCIAFGRSPELFRFHPLPGVLTAHGSNPTALVGDTAEDRIYPVQGRGATLDADGHHQATILASGPAGMTQVAADAMGRLIVIEASRPSATETIEWSEINDDDPVTMEERLYWPTLADWDAALPLDRYRNATALVEAMRPAGAYGMDGGGFAIEPMVMRMRDGLPVAVDLADGTAADRAMRIELVTTRGTGVDSSGELIALPFLPGLRVLWRERVGWTNISEQLLTGAFTRRVRATVRGELV